MYCSTCGTQVTAALNYCKNCGARIEKNAPEKQVPHSSSASTAVGFIGTFGLAGFIFLVITLLKLTVSSFALLAILSIYLLTVYELCKLLLAKLPEKLEKSKACFQNILPEEQISLANTAQLPSPSESFISATENTTRALNKTGI